MRYLLVFLLLSFCPPQDRSVYICTGPYAAHYHLDASCKGLRACKSAIVEAAFSKLPARLKTACHICAAGAVVPVKATVEAAGDSQCKATTKKGSRCSRKAAGSGYCWQHGG